MEAGACARAGQCRGATKASLTARCRTPSTRSGSSTTSLPAANSASSPRILSCWLCWTRCCSCAPGAGCVWTTAVWRCALTLCVAGGLAGVRDDWTGQAGAFQGCEATPVRQHQKTPWLLLSLRSHAHTPHVATRPPRFKLTSVATQYKIAEAHNLIPLANTEGLLLTEREEGKMFDIARCCWRNWFTNTASRLVADSPGRLSAGMLMHDIWRNMDNTVWRSTPGRLWAML